MNFDSQQMCIDNRSFFHFRELLVESNWRSWRRKAMLIVIQ